MKCFIINLSRDGGRKKLIIDEMERCNLNFSIIEAVDGSLLSGGDVGEYYNKKKSIQLFNNELSLGEIGCALSHVKIYQKMVLEDISSAVIMEDDICIIDSKIDDVLKNLEKTYAADCPVVVLLNYVKRYVSNKDDIVIDEKYALHDAYRGVSASGYFITKAAAKILAENIFPVYVVADKWEYFQEKFFPIKVLVPNCISLSDESLSSTIDVFGDRKKKLKLKFNINYYFNRYIKTIIFTFLKRPFIKIKRQKNVGNY
jgi:glycosyl transferase family 25